MGVPIKHVSIERAKEIVERGQAWYQAHIKEFEPKYHNHYIAIDIETGNYVVSSDDVSIHEEFREKFGSGRATFFRKIGGPYPHIRM